MEKLREYEVFEDRGNTKRGAKIPVGYQKIKVHLVFDMKHDGRRRARMVADGHLTEPGLESNYSGVVSLEGLETVIFLAELNNLKLYSTDISSAYLTAKCSEQVAIVAGSEFGELKDHVFIAKKALYGLWYSGKAFNEHLASMLDDLGFKPSKTEASIWFRKNGDVYEYVATYVDDLTLAMKDPLLLIEQLKQAPYNLKFKGTEELSFQLGCGFTRDPDGTLYMEASKYITRMEESYQRYFGELPSTKVKQPLEEGDHPELDTSEFLGPDEIQIYQSLIGMIQWAVSIGRFDIQCAVMTMSSFQAMPRKGHLDRLKIICGYLHSQKHFKIRFRTGVPDYSSLPDVEDDWTHSVYNNRKEILPDDAPDPLGKSVTITSHFDASLMHDVLSGKSVTGIIHYFNGFPVETYCKKPPTIECAIYGAEFIAGRTCFEQIIELCNYLQYLGVPINKKKFVFGDNKTMIKSSKFPASQLRKRHHILSYHFVRSIMSTDIISLHHLDSKSNSANITTKFWSNNKCYHSIIKPIFHWEGDTARCFDL